MTTCPITGTELTISGLHTAGPDWLKGTYCHGEEGKPVEISTSFDPQGNELYIVSIMEDCNRRRWIKVACGADY